MDHNAYFSRGRRDSWHNVPSTADLSYSKVERQEGQIEKLQHLVNKHELFITRLVAAIEVQNEENEALCKRIEKLEKLQRNGTSFRVKAAL